MIEQLLQDKAQIAMLTMGVISVIAHLYNSRDFRILALSGFALVSQFVGGVQGILILFIAAIIFPKRIRTMAMVLVAIAFLVPSEIKIYPFIIISLLFAEDFLGGDNWKKLKDAIPVFAFLFLFKEFYLNLEIVKILATLVFSLFVVRSLVFSSSLLKVLHIFYMSMALASLFILKGALSLDLMLFSILLAAVLSFANTYSIGEKVEQALDGAFYNQPNFFFSHLICLLFGPLILTSLLMTTDEALLIPFAIIQLQISFRIFTAYIKGMMANSPAAATVGMLPAFVILILSGFGIFMIKYFGHDHGYQYLLIWGVSILGLGLLYGAHYLWRKDHNIMNTDVRSLERMIDRLTWTVCCMEAPEQSAETLVQTPKKTSSTTSFTTGFPFVSVLFLTLVATLIIILQGLQL